MSNYTTNAQVNLKVNGESVERELLNLRHKLRMLQELAEKHIKFGDHNALKRTNAEIIKVQKQLKKVQEEARNVDHVMRNLDKASPKNLKATLTTLKRQLENIERGSKAWNEHMKKIKLVDAEIKKLNAEMRQSESWITRMNRKLNDWQTALWGVAAALTGVVYAGRKAVSSFASMEEEMTNTRKYTGMTIEDVNKLNEAFQNMNTRTPREELNKLAQEAGRLGKNTLQDVQGYVEAADIINVALVDLGEGATQTIAKLTNIFGIDELEGTKQAMLDVGSAVNVLSQNCTADKKYLVDFAQRMSGIGSQAKMTIQEILAFGATLDASGQKVEMSASALGRLTMLIFQKPGEMAKQVGLNVNEFNETLKRSTNEGLLMFLERIQQMGSKEGLAALAPLFKDLGLDGVRMSQVIATLANKLDMVKWEQDEANKAFAKGTSVMKEYNMYNKTAQAELDRAKKRIVELAIKLGEQLMPVMKHIYGTTSLFLRVLSGLINFFKEYKAEIITLTTIIVAQTIAVNASNIAFKAHYYWVVLCEKAQKIWMITAKSFNAVIIALRLVVAQLSGNIKKATILQRAWNQSMKANAIGIMISAVIALLYALGRLAKKMNEVSKEQKILNDIKKQGRQNAQEEIQVIEQLRKAAQNEALAENERLNACKKLNAINSSFCAGIDRVTGKYKESTKAVKDYINQLIKQYEIEGARDKLKEIGKKIADLVAEKKELVINYDKAVEDAKETDKFYQSAPGGGITDDLNTERVLPDPGHIKVKIAAQKIRDKNKELDALEKQQQAIINAYGTEIDKLNANEPSSPDNITTGGGYSYSGNDGGDDKPEKGDNDNTEKEKDRFEAEKLWKEKEEALNRIAYAKGEKNYREYTNRMHEIEQEYYEKLLEHTDLEGNERVQFEAGKYEAIKKISDAAFANSLEDENERHNKEMIVLKQNYAENLIDQEQYESESLFMEMTHQDNIIKLTKEGSKERNEAQAKLYELMVEDQKKRQKKYDDWLKEQEEKRKQREKELADFKSQYFGLNAVEDKEMFDKDMQTIEEVKQMELSMVGNNASERLRIEEAFEKAKLALKIKYHQIADAEEKNKLKKFVKKSIEWLESDAGKAFTGTFGAITEGMSNIFSGLTSIVQAELEIQTAAIEKKYDAEISAAEGNNYKIKQLEEQRQKEEAEAKKEANRKQFAMQVIQAVAQTAQGALAAYSSAAAIPATGWLMAPIAASMALAAGALQIAAIKKQQQASESQGYAEGGYTPKGDKYKAVGVVHAGEWVASQELLANPTTSAIISALDYAQRTNTIGSISASDVSSSVTANVVASRNNNRYGDNQNITSVISRLNDRLNEPFVTINTVQGDYGIKKAQEEYNNLIRNKSPKTSR